MSIMSTMTRAAMAEPRTNRVNEGRIRRPTAPAWDGVERRRFRPDGDLIWDWVALRQHYLRPKLHLLDLADLPPRAAPEPEPHWLEDPLTFQPLAAGLRRAFDVAAAALLLAVLWPVLLLAMALVKLTSPGPAVFRQRRIGYQCRTFAMFKLRTMVDGAHRLEDQMAGAGGATFLKLRNDPRTTTFGRFLRKSSLDELPQLVNVLRGEMSLVGPRPLLLSDFDKFPKQEQMRRFSVPPGITGLWQVSGRSATTDEQRIHLDLEYVERRSPWLDLVILLRTIPVALGAKGAY
jgi:lipopolysaccharide/colanic/teichoic acid biosynthesis glycosyltransferase